MSSIDTSKNISNKIIKEFNEDVELPDKKFLINNNINNNTRPMNYGNKWTSKEKKELLKMLKNQKISIDDDSDLYLNDIAKYLGRTEGGIKGEVKKIVFERYISGIEPENICKELNISLKNIRSLIKLHLEKDCDIEISNLEKENQLLKLKIENRKLREKLLKS